MTAGLDPAATQQSIAAAAPTVAPASGTASATTRLDVVDAMRGVAIALVVVYHFGALDWRLAQYDARGWILVPHLSPLQWLKVPFLHFGFVGVHAFFVLSGFCIHLRGARAIALHEPPVPSLRSFFLRRFWRIYPPYWIALALFAAAPHIAHALGWTTQAPPPGATDIALHATMLHTLDARTFFSINPAFWSLATEEQFYLGYPLLALALARFGARRVAAVALLVSLAWRAGTLALVPATVEHFMDWRVLVHGLFLPRWYDWILGCLLADVVAAGGAPLRRWRWPLLGLGAALLLAGVACRAHVAADKLGGDVLYSSAFAALLGGLLGGAAPGARARPRGWLTRLPASSLRVLGRRAYGIYLVHQPLVDLLAWPLAVRALVVATASALFCRFCEAPFEARSRRVPRPPCRR